MKSLKEKEKTFFKGEVYELTENSKVFLSESVKEAVLEFKDEILSMEEEIGTAAKLHIYNMIDKWFGDFENEE